MTPREREAIYVRYVRHERWLNVAASAWLAAVALLIAGWLVGAILLQTGFSLFDVIRPLP